MRMLWRGLAITSVVGASLGMAVAPALADGGGFSSAPAPTAVGNVLPNSSIQGTPAKFNPSALQVTAKWNSAQQTCTQSVESFTITNNESKAETIKFPHHAGSLKIGPKTTTGICIDTHLSGTTGTIKLARSRTAKLKLTIS